MMKSIARVFHYSPFEMEQMYLDEIDHLGLIFWYNDSIEFQKEIAKQLGGK